MAVKLGFTGLLLLVVTGKTFFKIILFNTKIFSSKCQSYCKKNIPAKDLQRILENYPTVFLLSAAVLQWTTSLTSIANRVLHCKS